MFHFQFSIMSIFKFSITAFLLSILSYKLYYLFIKFILSFFLSDNINSIKLEFEDFPLLYNTSLQACIIGLILGTFLFLIKNFQIKQVFFFQALEIIFLSKISIGILGFIYAKYQIESSIVQLQKSQEVSYCLKQFYSYNLIGVILALFLIYVIFNTIRISFVNKYETIDNTQ